MSRPEYRVTKGPQIADGNKQHLSFPEEMAFSTEVLLTVESLQYRTGALSSMDRQRFDPNGSSSGLEDTLEDTSDINEVT